MPPCLPTWAFHCPTPLPLSHSWRSLLQARRAVGQPSIRLTKVEFAPIEGEKHGHDSGPHFVADIKRTDSLEQRVRAASASFYGSRGQSPQKGSRGEYSRTSLFEFCEMGIARDEEMCFRGARQSNEVIIPGVRGEPGCYLWVGFNRG